MSDADSGADPTEPGTEEWSFENGGLVDSSPTVVDGTVYVGSTDGTLYAVAATSGEEESSSSRLAPGDTAHNCPSGRAPMVVNNRLAAGANLLNEPQGIG